MKKETPSSKTIDHKKDGVSCKIGHLSRVKQGLKIGALAVLWLLSGGSHSAHAEVITLHTEKLLSMVKPAESEAGGQGVKRVKSGQELNWLNAEQAQSSVFVKFKMGEPLSMNQEEAWKQTARWRQPRRVTMPVSVVVGQGASSSLAVFNQAEQHCSVFLNVSDSGQGALSESLEASLGLKAVGPAEEALWQWELDHELGHCDERQNAIWPIASSTVKGELSPNVVKEMLRGTLIGEVWDETYADVHAGLRRLEQAQKESDRTSVIKLLSLMEALRVGGRELAIYEKKKDAENKGTVLNEHQNVMGFKHASDEALHELRKNATYWMNQPGSLSEKASRLTQLGVKLALKNTPDADRMMDEVVGVKERWKDAHEKVQEVVLGVISEWAIEGLKNKEGVSDEETLKKRLIPLKEWTDYQTDPWSIKASQSYQGWVMTMAKQWKSFQTLNAGKSESWADEKVYAWMFNALEQLKKEAFKEQEASLTRLEIQLRNEMSAWWMQGMNQAGQGLGSRQGLLKISSELLKKQFKETLKTVKEPSEEYHAWLQSREDRAIKSVEFVREEESVPKKKHPKTF